MTLKRVIAYSVFSMIGIGSAYLVSGIALRPPLMASLSVQQAVQAATPTPVPSIQATLVAATYAGTATAVAKNEAALNSMESRIRTIDEAIGRILSEAEFQGRLVDSSARAGDEHRREAYLMQQMLLQKYGEVSSPPGTGNIRMPARSTPTPPAKRRDLTDLSSLASEVDRVYGRVRKLDEEMRARSKLMQDQFAKDRVHDNRMDDVYDGLSHYFSLPSTPTPSSR